MCYVDFYESYISWRGFQGKYYILTYLALMFVNITTVSVFIYIELNHTI